ncbi:hypothetical protein ACUN9Y_13210 [Halomonas sp. V046]|uniref:hypothetical protein n=1 Tax=Halomonas sp. V046 TaxID=3459611 RepID=UPI0040450130
MARRYDWEAIEADFRTGRFSLQKLSDRHGPSKGAISKRATTHGWSKDLTGAVQQRTREKLSRPESAAPDVPEAELIEQAACENASVVNGHRQMLQRWRRIQDTFAGQLDTQLSTGKREVETRDGDVIEVDVDLEYAGKCIGYGTQALERVIKLERQSYGMDLPAGEETPPEHALTDDELEAKIKAYESRGADDQS